MALPRVQIYTENSENQRPILPRTLRLKSTSLKKMVFGG
jgi:hypothetical protein